MILATAVAYLWLTGCQHHHHHHHDEHKEHVEATEETITMDKVPANVRAAFDKEFPGARLKEVEKEVYRSGDVHYAFEFVNKDGVEMEVEYNTAGERLPEH
jgi:uncharacterized membrane protein YkoI